MAQFPDWELGEKERGEFSPQVAEASALSTALGGFAPLLIYPILFGENIHPIKTDTEWGTKPAVPGSIFRYQMWPAQLNKEV